MAEVNTHHAAHPSAGDIQPSTPFGKASTPANDDGPRKSAIVTARKPGVHDMPDMTPEEHKRRGDAADALSREMKRQIAGRLKKPGGN